ncbi:MAG TPA: tetratricopeptide repeat protein, partial [Thermoanaerobaculia bacterium]|nr:tetratricopeptide repeat protein [Thermoanaerobaculia bacterium]
VTVAPVSRSASDQAQVVPGVPVRTFGFERCGPGSLSVALAALGDPVSIEELAAVLPKADNGGVLSLDLVREARRRGHDAQLVTGSPELVRDEVVAGRPAVLMLRVLDAPGVQDDYYHYVVADGWDPQRQLVRVQFGDGKARWTPFANLERAWQPAGHATLVVRPGPPTAAPTENATRFAAALEAAGRPEEAASLYRKLLEDEPSPLLWTNLGNAETAAGNRDEALAAYRQAVALAPDDGDALNNLAWLLYERRGEPAGDEHLEEAEALARQAVAAGGPDPYLALDTLGRILHARGDCEEASRMLVRASETAPAGETRAAVDLALGNALADCDRPAEARAALARAAESGDEATRRQSEAALTALAALARPAEPTVGEL